MIIRDELNANYTIISNEIIRSKDLSNNAKLLAVILSGLPTDWIVNTKYLSNALNIGVRSVQRAFKELIELNFIRKMQMLDEKSKKFTGSFSVVFISANENEKEISKKIEKAEKETINSELFKQTSKEPKSKTQNFKFYQPNEKESEEEEAKISSEESDENQANFTQNLEAENLEKIDQTSGEFTENLEANSPILADLKQMKALNIAQNRNFSQATNSRHAVFCRTYKLKEELQKKNFYIMKNFGKNIFFIFKKANLKKENLDLSFFDELEQEKIKEWLKYKAQKRPLNILSKNHILKQLKDFKAQGQNISEIIDRSILRNWQGLFLTKKPNKPLTQQEILNAILRQEPNFTFTADFNLSKVKINGKSVKYNAKNDTYTLF